MQKILMIAVLLASSLSTAQNGMQQLASDNFNRANAATLGINWTPLSGTNNNVAFQIVNHQIESTSSGCCAKELYYGGINWPADQYSQIQIAAFLEGVMGPAVRMNSNDSHYGCLVTGLGTGNAGLMIVLDVANVYTTLASASTVTISAGDVIRCSVQSATISMINETTSTTLATATDSTLPSGYPGLITGDAGMPVTYNVMANWSGGASGTPVSTQLLASDSFNRSDSVGLGSAWNVGPGHGPLQIVSDRIEPYPSGGPQPSKEHYIGYGPFPNDQWSQGQVVVEDQLGDNGAELRASDSADTMYVCDVNQTGPAGTAETRIVKVLNGVISPIVTDQQWSAVSPGDYIRGQVLGNLISLIDVTTGQLLLSAVDFDVASGYPGWSMQLLNGTVADHISANWFGGSFNAATLVSIAVTPTNASIAKGGTQQYTATGTYSDNSQQNLTSSVNWSSSSTAVATVTSAGLASGVGTGSTNISATLGSVSGSTVLTVTAPVLVSIAVTPSNVSIVVGGSQPYTATGTYSDNSQQNLTSAVTWSSSNTAVASITGAGLANAVSKGSTVIGASLGSINGSTGLTVTAPLVSIAVTPANNSVPAGTTVQYTATGTYSDNTQQNLTSSVTWSSTSTSIATISGAGLATAVGPGSTTVQANLGSVSGSTNLTVTAAVLVSINVTPANAQIVVGATQQYSATGVYSDGSQVNLTSNVTWNSSATSIATLTSSGLATGVAVGSTTIQATLGAVSNSTALSVTSPIVGQFVQFASGDSGGATSHTTYTDHNPATGNLLLVFAHWDNQSVTASVSDNLGNTYTTISGPVNVGKAGRFQAWYSKNIRGGAQIGATITFSGKTTSLSLLDLAEYFGLDTSSPLDVAGSAVGSGNVQDSGASPATNNSSETIVGLFGYDGYAALFTQGAAYTIRGYDASSMMEDRAVSTIGQFHATATSNGSMNWVAYVIAFKNGH